MATGSESRLCSQCHKPPAKYVCTGCQEYFCPKDFREHEQQLIVKFDSEIVRSHDELLYEIQKLEKSNNVSLDLFGEIEQWKKTTIQKVEQAADRARHELTELIDKQRTEIKKQFETITKEIQTCRNEENFVETDIDRLQMKINEIRESVQQLLETETTKSIIVDHGQIDWNQILCVRASRLQIPSLNLNTKWRQNGVTVAGGNGKANGMNQLYYPWGLCVDHDQTIYIADCGNHRVVEWKNGAASGRVVAGGNGSGNRSDQLSSPRDVIIDKKTNSLIISDYDNKRVVRWSRQNAIHGETIISNIGCCGLTMDNDGLLYVVDFDKHEVRRYRIGGHEGTVVAGGNGEGNHCDQLNNPTYVFVDQDHSVYVSDENNHRVMKWMKDAKQGIVVAGGKNKGNGPTKLSNPYGIFVDQSGSVYVADYANDRITRWCQGSLVGTVIVGENGKGNQSNQIYAPTGLSFDRDCNLYVCENRNHRVQKFNINRS
ncbi:unnamed protein product [Rotaria sp. Silwood1]|nr:unnamed protein product [Rotaria sp. Silwood1]CAF3502157.1 unnamed protein product [Rotaria sp. Silwood1]CAF3562591.1 unnamed protein product [Rotaria sp. Silwood1]CAF4816187.1 unnamed protein product [Rotaria sp. Silwood1]CAF4846500.1 unnamed protein product [Rotaria sp. Silwood1]